MRYELWEICDFDEFAVQAMILNKSFENFTDAYFAFRQLIKTTPCCIILNKGEKNETI
jgi:hypothetical protein